MLKFYFVKNKRNHDKYKEIATVYTSVGYKKLNTVKNCYMYITKFNRAWCLVNNAEGNWINVL